MWALFLLPEWQDPWSGPQTDEETNQQQNSAITKRKEEVPRATKFFG
jgi:hypothetical protein